MTRERVPAVAWGRDVPESIHSLGLANPDYVDLFTAPTNERSAKSAEHWARAVLEGGPRHLGLAVFVAQRLLLGLRLGPRRSPDYIHRWRIADRGEGWVRIEAASWMMTAALVFKVDDTRVSLAAFVRYDRRVAALVWQAGHIVHRTLVLALMRRAVRNNRAARPSLTDGTSSP
jgi:hypothetical protein